MNSLTSSSCSVLYNLSLHPPGSCTAHLKIIFCKFDLNLNSKFKPPTCKSFSEFWFKSKFKEDHFHGCVELFRVSKCYMLNKLRWAVTSTFLADNNLSSTYQSCQLTILWNSTDDMGRFLVPFILIVGKTNCQPKFEKEISIWFSVLKAMSV